jgi:hypothetical protein
VLTYTLIVIIILSHPVIWVGTARWRRDPEFVI